MLRLGMPRCSHIAQQINSQRDRLFDVLYAEFDGLQRRVHAKQRAEHVSDAAELSCVVIGAAKTFSDQKAVLIVFDFAHRLAPIRGSRSCRTA